MSDVLTVEKLDESLLEGTPPCEIWEGNVQCGQPSVARVTTTCPFCRHTAISFMCQICLDDLHKLEVDCALCLTLLPTWKTT